jgi:putative sigma-54 modulation protein
MKKNVKATNIELTPAIDDYLDRRFSAFDRFIKEDSAATCLVEVGKTTKHHKSGDVFRAEVNLTISGKNFYAFSEKDDLYAAIDEVKDEIVYQLSSYKDKTMTLMRKGALKVKNMVRGLGDRTDRRK